MPLEFLSLEQALAASWPPETWRDVTVVAAVSGGADSVALACVLAKLKSLAGGPGGLCVAHFNHRLRPAAADDAEFVRSLANQLGVRCEMGESDVAASAARRGDGVEAAARHARYDFLLQTAQRLGARYVATAHTADDQVETILFNVLRGSGLAGLAGIPRARPLSSAVTAIRPLLGVRRRDVLAYLQARGQDFRVDATNQSLDFTRNRLRLELLPALRERYRFDVDNSLLRLGNIASDAQRLIERLAGELLDRCLLPCRASSTGTVRIDVRPLKDQDRHLVREMFVLLWQRQNWPLQAMGFDEWELLADWVQRRCKTDLAPAGKLTLPGNIAIDCTDDRLIQLTPPPAQ